MNAKNILIFLNEEDTVRKISKIFWNFMPENGDANNRKDQHDDYQKEDNVCHVCLREK